MLPSGSLAWSRYIRIEFAAPPRSRVTSTAGVGPLRRNSASQTSLASSYRCIARRIVEEKGRFRRRNAEGGGTSYIATEGWANL
jgi:hypothetical protein